MLKCEHCGEDLLLLEVSLQKTAIYTLIHGDAFDEIIDKDILDISPQSYRCYECDTNIDLWDDIENWLNAHPDYQDEDYQNDD